MVRGSPANKKRDAYVALACGEAFQRLAQQIIPRIHGPQVERAPFAVFSSEMADLVACATNLTRYPRQSGRLSETSMTRRGRTSSTNCLVAGLALRSPKAGRMLRSGTITPSNHGLFPICWQDRKTYSSRGGMYSSLASPKTVPISFTSSSTASRGAPRRRSGWRLRFAWAPPALVVPFRRRQMAPKRGQSRESSGRCDLEACGAKGR